MLTTIVVAIHIVVALLLIIIVLFQQGKGAAMGSAFGGSSQTLFGSRGPATALAKVTTGAAVIFMVTSIALSVLSSNVTDESIIQDSDAPLSLPTSLPGEEGTTQPVEPSGPVASETVEPVEAPSEPVGPVETPLPDSDTQ